MCFYKKNLHISDVVNTVLSPLLTVECGSGPADDVGVVRSSQIYQSREFKEAMIPYFSKAVSSWLISKSIHDCIKTNTTHRESVIVHKAFIQESHLSILIYVTREHKTSL